MRRLIFTVAVALLMWPMLASATDETGCFGTKIEFRDTPREAAAEAKKSEKLVFVLHVSGNFEDPRFT